MINLFPKKNQTGAATLVITAILLVSISLIAIFAGNYSVMQQKIIANGYRSQQAYEAAEAGLEFGINYFQQNGSAIIATATGGFIPPYSDSNTNNVALANGSRYTITYANPVANNYRLITVTSTGTSDDGTASRTVSQQINYGSILYSAPTSTLITRGELELSGSARIVNTQTNSTVQSGSETEISGSGQTTISTGVGSNSSSIGSDVQQNNSSLSSQSVSSFFASYFGVNTTVVQNNATYTFSELGNYSSSLSGKTGSLIWLNQTVGDATINGNITIGSAASPVILIVNGNLNLGGSAIIYGLVFVLGSATTDIIGNSQIIGGLISVGDLNVRGNTTITYSSSVLTNIQNTVNTYYAKVPGSWRDF